MIERIDRSRSPECAVGWRGGSGLDAWWSYVVARRIRISLEDWDRTEVDFQEQVIGRHKYSGARIGNLGEREPLDLDRADKDGKCADRRQRPCTARGGGGQ